MSLVIFRGTQHTRPDTNIYTDSGSRNPQIVLGFGSVMYDENGDQLGALAMVYRTGSLSTALALSISVLGDGTRTTRAHTYTHRGSPKREKSQRQGDVWGLQRNCTTLCWHGSACRYRCCPFTHPKEKTQRCVSTRREDEKASVTKRRRTELQGIEQQWRSAARLAKNSVMPS